LVKRLAEARQRAASPLAESWGETKSLVDVLDAADDPEDACARLRAAARRIVGSIHCVIVAHGRNKAAAFQLWFNGAPGKHRDYLVAYWHRPTKWEAVSTEFK